VLFENGSTEPPEWWSGPGGNCIEQLHGQVFSGLP
jgi:hypothetical protein